MSKINYAIASLKVRVHRVSEIRQLFRFNQNRSKVSGINKRFEVRSLGKEFGCNVLVETGTYLGEMLEFQRNNFERLYSIELSDFYYDFSRNRLRKYSNIHFCKGDSAELLKTIIEKLGDRDRALFWLDGHFSGGLTARGQEDTPIVQELKDIFASGRKQDVILIDDARCFNGKHGYPTIAEMKKLCEDNGRIFECYDDLIRMLPVRTVRGKSEG